ncbi:MAG: 8-amino-7-oxononanoate synthase [Bacteroidales bacterium]|nr:8-amino-7-oxononanoate synthase [Bacteroidales bacterium]
MENSRYQHIINELKTIGNYRFLPNHTDMQGIDLSSNDYLGLNSNANLQEEFISSFAGKLPGFGAGSSRLLSGNGKQYQVLEQTIGNLYQHRQCLVYNSGYHANIGILPAIAGKNDLIVADKFVHASIIDGALLSQAKLLRYGHLNYQQLERIIAENKKKVENIFIVSESLFSMDGDFCDLQQLAGIKKKYHCYLYIDEAHALGVWGHNGLGLAEKEGLIEEIDFLVGTFGKALASVGAFVVCNAMFKDYLVNRSRPLIFTTGLPPVNLAWTNFVFSKLSAIAHLREKLNALIESVATILAIKAQSQIVPLILGDNEKAIRLSGKLRQHGFYVLPIRYPAVPKGTARLRFSLRANINPTDLLPLKHLIATI